MGNSIADNSTSVGGRGNGLTLRNGEGIQVGLQGGQYTSLDYSTPDYSLNGGRLDARSVVGDSVYDTEMVRLQAMAESELASRRGESVSTSNIGLAANNDRSFISNPYVEKINGAGGEHWSSGADTNPVADNRLAWRELPEPVQDRSPTIANAIAMGKYSGQDGGSFVGGIRGDGLSVFESPSLAYRAGQVARFAWDVSPLGAAQEYVHATVNGNPLGAVLAVGSVFVPEARVEGAAERALASATVRSEAAANVWEARRILAETRPDLPVWERNQIIQAFDIESFRVNTLTSPVSEFRYFDDLPNGAGLQGRWSTSQWFETPAERITNLALPNNQATRAATVTLQPGTTVFQGTVSPQLKYGSNLTGGGFQSYNAMGPRAIIKELP